MVFHCRCFSILLQEEEEDIEEYESRTQTKSTVTQTYYTAASEFNRSVLNFAEKASNLRVFTLPELKAATKNFSRGSKIGEGGFGTVYKGVVKSSDHPFDEIPVAVKLAKGLLQGRIEWETEINIFGAVEHPNLVKLIGYCAEENEESATQLLLVYEYMVNGCLRDHLSEKSETPLSWDIRLKVARDAARGLTYLHEQMEFQIILRDFKSSTILLDDQWNAKLSDFGLAQLGPRQGIMTPFETDVVGTLGYAAPEYVLSGRLTSKCDVWSYGVFLYELITGRCPFDRRRPRNEQKLLEWIKPYLVDSKKFQKIIDPKLEDNYPLKSVQKLSIIAKSCLCRDPKSRPKMSEVLEMVNNLIEVPSQAVNPVNKSVSEVLEMVNNLIEVPSQAVNPVNKSVNDSENGSSSCLSCFGCCVP